MHTKIYWIHQFDNGAHLGIMARPRGNDWLEDEIINLRNNKIGVLVSLLEGQEIHELDLDREEELCLANGIQYINFPVKDRSVPVDNDSANKLISLIVEKLNEELSVVIHCRMGIGRSSIIAGAVLLKYNLKAKDILDRIVNVRGVNVPDTEMQLEWLKRRE